MPYSRSPTHTNRERSHRSTRKRSRERSSERRHKSSRSSHKEKRREPSHFSSRHRDSVTDSGRSYASSDIALELGGSSANRTRLDKRKEKINEQTKSIDEIVDADENMMRMMGFSNFDTTKNKRVDGNIAGEAKINRARKYRQYMNRRGGFNRPLDYVA